MEIVIASSNLHKIREFREMLKGLKGLDLLSLTQFPDYIEPEETGLTFTENSELKAVHAAKTLNKYALADDSGLVVPALNGEPGIYSKRYAGTGADSDNRKKLLQALQKLGEESRIAFFECALTLASPSGVVKTVSAKCEGTLILEERGNKGFGYDPLFVKYDYDKTFGELPENVKNRISHRYKAFEKMFPTIESLCIT